MQVPDRALELGGSCLRLSRWCARRLFTIWRQLQPLAGRWLGLAVLKERSAEYARILLKVSVHLRRWDPRKARLAEKRWRSMALGSQRRRALTAERCYGSGRGEGVLFAVSNEVVEVGG